MENEDDDLPVRPEPSDLEELEPHERTVERVAGLYFRACESLAEAIQAVKAHLEGD